LKKVKNKNKKRKMKYGKRSPSKHYLLLMLRNLMDLMIMERSVDASQLIKRN
jgi:hypothetical protein